MDIFGFSEVQWLVIAICSSGIFYTIGRRVGIGDCLDWMREEGHIDYDD